MAMGNEWFELCNILLKKKVEAFVAFLVSKWQNVQGPLTKSEDGHFLDP